jgi:large subunit ribosomal protein L28
VPFSYLFFTAEASALQGHNVKALFGFWLRPPRLNGEMWTITHRIGLHERRPCGMIRKVVDDSEVIPMAKCEMCGKGPKFGHNVSRSKQATGRQFKPNIQRVKVEIKGQTRRMNLCTRCLRTLNKTR